MRALPFNLFFLLFASPLAQASYTVNLTPGVTPISHDIYNLHMTIFWICVAIGVVVFSVMFYAIIYHRKANGFKADQFHSNIWIELTWTMIPLVILILMAIPATRVLINMDDNAVKPDITIKITGYQWKWRYEYLDHGINFFSNLSTPFDQLSGKAPKGPHYLREVDHPLVLPIHKKVRFLITSNDVIHSWWLPDLGVKRDAIPGYINESWARINRPGMYQGQCAELCGINHALMPIVILAVSEKGFNDWIAQQKGGKPPVTPSTATSPTGAKPTTAPTAAAPATTAPKKYTMEELMKHGEQVFLGTCAACHKPDGTGQPPVFPALKGSPIATGPLPAHLNRVLNGKPGTAMQAFKTQFNDDDLAAVITYERNAWGNNTGEAVQPSQVEAARKLPPGGT